MFMNEQRLPGPDERRGGMPALLRKVLAFAVGAIVLAVSLAFSILFFAFALTVGLIIAGRIWWKTRKLRQEWRERPPGGRIIEGDVVDRH